MSDVTPPIQPAPARHLLSPLDGDLWRRLIKVLQAHGIRRAGVFGSIARGEARPESDLDLLVEPPATMTLFGLSALALALEDLVQRPVDLVTYASLNPRLRASVYDSYQEFFDADHEQTRDLAQDEVEEP